MQLIAASKMRRAQQMVQEGRAYANYIREVVADLVALVSLEEEGVVTPLLAVRPVQRTLLLTITPDRGLAGALVSNINRIAATAIRTSESPVSAVAVGRKGTQFMTRTRQDLRATFSVSDRPRLEDTVAVSRLVQEQFLSGEADRVLIAYTEFVNTAVQRAVIRTLLPVEPAEQQTQDEAGYIYEPSPQVVLDSLVPRYVETQVYHAILESIASEHSARMVAMKNATDNANELVDDLTLALNKARQEQITTELLDVVGGAAAVAR